MNLSELNWLEVIRCGTRSEKRKERSLVIVSGSKCKNYVKSTHQHCFGVAKLEPSWYIWLEATNDLARFRVYEKVPLWRESIVTKKPRPSLNKSRQSCEHRPVLAQ
jgi:hypothetical protein